MKCRSALLLLGSLLLLTGVSWRAFPFSLPLDEVDANASLLILASHPNPQPSDSEDPSMGVAPMIGVSVPIAVAGPMFVEPGLELLGWYYRWNSNAGAAEITQSENGLGFFTIGAILSLQAGVRFPIATDLTLGGAIGLDFFARVPAEFQNTGSSVKSDEDSAVGWFYGKGRFFYPETRAFLRWHVSEPVDLVFNVRAFYPVYHFWDGAGQPFWDALMISGGVGFAIRLKPAASAAALTAPAAK